MSYNFLLPLVLAEPVKCHQNACELNRNGKKTSVVLVADISRPKIGNQRLHMITTYDDVIAMKSTRTRRRHEPRAINACQTKCWLRCGRIPLFSPLFRSQVTSTDVKQTRNSLRCILCECMFWFRDMDNLLSLLIFFLFFFFVFLFFSFFRLFSSRIAFFFLSYSNYYVKY